VPQIIRQRGTRSGRHHLGTPGDIISECLGGFVGIRKETVQIIGPAGQYGVPTRSLFQTAGIGLKVRGKVAWVVHPGAVQYMTGANW